MSTIIMGDIAAGAVWWSQADWYKRVLAQRYAINNAFMQEWHFPKDGVKIFVKMVAGQPQAWIYVGGGHIYMECGIIDFSTAILSQEYYMPGTFHTSFYLPTNKLNGLISYTGEVLRQKALNYWDLILTPPVYVDAHKISSADIPEGTLSCATGNMYIDLVDIAETGELPLSFPEVVKGYNKTDYSEKKTLMSLFPGSMFTGMAKLFIQSIYGSDRNDLHISIDQDFNYIGIEIPLIEKLWTEFNSTLPLRPYTFGYNVVFLNNMGTYSIAIMIVETQTFQVRELVSTNPLANKLLKEYASFTDPVELQKIQSFVLSTCVVGNILLDWTPIVNPPTAGTPLNYSWKFSNDGTKGVMVLYTGEGVNSFNTTFTKAELEIAWIFNDSILEVTATASETSTGSISTFLTNIHISTPHRGKVQWLAGHIPAGQTPNAGQVSSGSAVVYAYFDKNTAVDVTLTQGITSPALLVTPEYTTAPITGVETVTILTDVTHSSGGLMVGGASISVGLDTISGTWSNGGATQGVRIIAEGRPATNPTSANAVGIGPGLIAGGITGYSASEKYFNNENTADEYSALYGTFLDTFSTFTEVRPSSYAAQAICIPDKDASAVLIYDYRHNTSASYQSVDILNDSKIISEVAAVFHHGPSGSAPSLYDPRTFNTNYSFHEQLSSTNVDTPPVQTHQLKVYMAGGDAGVDLIETNTTIDGLTDPVLRALFYPWVTGLEDIPSISTVQSIQGSYLAFYQASLASHTRHFDYRAAVGWA